MPHRARSLAAGPCTLQGVRSLLLVPVLVACTANGPPDAGADGGRLLADAPLAPRRDGCIESRRYRDGDGDGDGDPATAALVCPATAIGYVWTDTDCDDTRATV